MPEQKSALNVVMVGTFVASHMPVIDVEIGVHDIWCRGHRGCDTTLFEAGSNDNFRSRSGARVSKVEDVGKILDVFQAHGHSEVRPTLSCLLRLTDPCDSSTLPGFTVREQARRSLATSNGRSEVL